MAIALGTDEYRADDHGAIVTGSGVMAGEADSTAELLRALTARGLTVAIAESLTGGELAAELTRPAGASAVVLGGVVVYATELKHTLCGVDAALLAEHGPVHPEVARRLAEGVRHRLAVGGRPASIGLATTGVAGPATPDGCSPGTVFIGIADDAGSDVIELALSGGRADIRHLTVERAIQLLLRRFGPPATAPTFGGAGAE